MLRSLTNSAFLAILLAASALHAQDGCSDAILRFQRSHIQTDDLLGRPLTIADFDHDGHPDGALLLRSGNHFQIEVRLRSHQLRSVNFISYLADLSVSAEDVNQDGSPDLVVASVFSNQRLFVWLNDGRGSFYAALVTDYPAKQHGDSPNVTVTIPGRDDGALIESSKVRHGRTVIHPNRPIIPAQTAIVHESFRIVAQAHASPNLIRGPPSTPSL